MTDQEHAVQAVFDAATAFNAIVDDAHKAGVNVHIRSTSLSGPRGHIRLDITKTYTDEGEVT